MHEMKTKGLKRKSRRKKRSQRLRSTKKLRYTWLAERLFLAWVRTSIALIALGFLLARIGAILQWMGASSANANISPIQAALAGIALIALGGFVSIVATWRYYTTRKAIRRGRVVYSSSHLSVIVGVITAAVGAALIAFLVRAIVI